MTIAEIIEANTQAESIDVSEWADWQIQQEANRIMPAKDSKYQTIGEAALHIALNRESMKRAGWGA